MSVLEQQVIQLRRELQLLKNNQVTIFDSEPRSPTSQTIWREGAVMKIWDGRNWNTTGGGIVGFSLDTVFTADDYNTISWSAGTINVGSVSGTVTSSISSGSFDMTTTTYFYWQSDIPNAIQTTTVSATAVFNGGILVAVGYPNSDTTGKAIINVFG